MSKPVTIEDIYELFRASQAEADRKFAASKEEDERRTAEIDRLFAASKEESERRAAEIDRLFAESKAENERRKAEDERRKEESERRAAEADRKFAASKEESDRRAAEIDRLFAASKAEDERRKAEDERRKAEDERRKEEADRSMAELKKTVERTSKAVDSLTTRWGRFVEELVEPAVIRIFQAWGIDIKEIYPSARSEREPIPMEIHILAVDETELVLVECKCKLTQEDVDEFLEKLPQFKLAFSHYKNYQVYGAVAGIEINEGIDRYAYRKGLFVIKPSEDTVAIINDEGFKPSSW